MVWGQHLKQEPVSTVIKLVKVKNNGACGGPVDALGFGARCSSNHYIVGGYQLLNKTSWVGFGIVFKISISHYQVAQQIKKCCHDITKLDVEGHLFKEKI